MNRPEGEIMHLFDAWVIPMIMQEYSLDENSAIRSFIGSLTYQMLEQEELKLWRESPLLIFDLYKSEQLTGDPRNSTYIKGDELYAESPGA
ncbi:MAG: hypothetical protein LBK67_03180 [Coriobacteriales bacterium]|jgi:hypothetical protein|nr:hypothetical protein [Coriobacteriales bacterium]